MECHHRDIAAGARRFRLVVRVNRRDILATGNQRLFLMEIFHQIGAQKGFKLDSCANLPRASHMAYEPSN